MKKIVILLFLSVVMMLTVTACGNEAMEVQETEEVYKTKYVDAINIWIDPTTGVQYIVCDGYYGIGITPRIDKYGKPVLGKSEVE